MRTAGSEDLPSQPHAPLFSVVQCASATPAAPCASAGAATSLCGLPSLSALSSRGGCLVDYGLVAVNEADLRHCAALLLRALCHLAVGAWWMRIRAAKCARWLSQAWPLGAEPTCRTVGLLGSRAAALRLMPTSASRNIVPTQPLLPGAALETAAPVRAEWHESSLMNSMPLPPWLTLQVGRRAWPPHDGPLRTLSRGGGEGAGKTSRQPLLWPSECLLRTAVVHRVLAENQRWPA